MNLSNYYWYFTSVIPPRICDDIVKHGLSKADTMARTGGYDNKKYKLNQYYDWHCDSWDKPYQNPGPDLGKIRKLSMTCQLTDGSEYQGGELEFDFRNYDPHLRNKKTHIIQAKEILPKGSIVVFPSFVWHRVKPVTKGTRYSLVMWNLGYPFK